MCRIASALAICALLSTLLLSTAEASDGDMDYSAPYITIDPETGELITVNPGPKPVMHDMQVAAEQQNGVDSASGSGDEPNAASQSQSPYIAIAGAIAALIGLAVLLYRKARHQPVRESSRVQPI